MNRTISPILNRVRFLAVLLSMALPMLGCCTQPSRSDAIAQIKARYQDNAFEPHPSGNYVRFVNVEYENGYRQDANKYAVAATITITYNKSLEELRKEFRKHDSRHQPNVSPEEAFLLWTYTNNVVTNNHFGASWQVQFVFLKTTKGWVIQ
jgi:hypothetical protein